MKIAEAFVEIRVRSDKAKGEARDQARETANEVTRTFAQYFTGAVVVRELRKMTDAASNLEQAIGGTAAVFGKARFTIDRYARDSAQAMGLSERAFRELTSQIGGLLTGLGFTQVEAANTSVQLAQLGADLSATFGGTPEEAVYALGAALRGEFDPLERFGVSLRASSINLKAVELGLAESTSKVGDNARAQAALTLIMEQSTNAQGQFNREKDTAAGKTARFTGELENQRAVIGKGLLPVYNSLLDSLGLILDVFGALPSQVQTGVVALVAIAAVAGPIKRTTEALGGLQTMLTRVSLTHPVFATIAGVAAATAIAIKIFGDAAKSARLDVDELADSMVRMQDPLAGMADQIAGLANENDRLREFLAAGGGSFDGLARAALGGEAALLSYKAALIDNARASGNAVEYNTDLEDTLLSLVPTAAEASRKYEQMTQLSGEAAAAVGEGLTPAVDANTTALDANTAALGEVNTATRYVITTTGRMSNEWDDAATAADSLMSTLEAIVGTYLDLDEATDQLTEHTEDLRATLEENGATLDQMTEKGRANRAAVRGQVEAIFDYAEASLRAGDSTDTVAAKVGVLTEQLRENMLQAGFTEEEVDAYLATLNLTPDSITTAIELTNDEIARTKVQEHLDSLEGVPDEIETAIQAMIDEGAYAAAQARINALASARTVQLAPSITNPSYTSPSGATFSSTGRFVAGGSNLLTYVGEVAGRSGDEVILPLGSSQRSRLAELISDPRVAGPLADVMAPVAAGGGESVIVNIGPVYGMPDDRTLERWADRTAAVLRGRR